MPDDDEVFERKFRVGFFCVAEELSEKYFGLGYFSVDLAIGKGHRKVYSPQQVLI